MNWTTKSLDINRQRQYDLSIMKNEYEVRAVTRDDCSPFILGIHYAQRFPSVSYAFGLFRKEELAGVITYGTPPSAPLRSGVCGREFTGKVIELNRLVLRDNLKNEASLLVSRSLKMLPAGKVIVSFADTSQGHVGYVYQATNFLYTGLSAKRTNWAVKGKEGLHGQTIADEFRGVPHRSKALREKYGDDFTLVDRPRKHRYVIFTGSKKFKKDARKNLRYPVLPYPKGEKSDLIA